jgi:hypothetical protein
MVALAKRSANRRAGPSADEASPAIGTLSRLAAGNIPHPSDLRAQSHQAAKKA